MYVQIPKEVSEVLPLGARRPNTMLRWLQPFHSSVLLVDVWSVDEITVYKRPINYNLQFSYATTCGTNNPSEYVSHLNIIELFIFMHVLNIYRIHVEFISSFTNCEWRTIHQFVPPTSCDDIFTTYLRPVQFTSRWGKKL